MACDATELGVRIKEERLRIGWSQTRFGEVGGVSKASQIVYERGGRFPDAQYLCLLGQHGIDIGYLLWGRREPEGATGVSWVVMGHVAHALETWASENGITLSEERRTWFLRRLYDAFASNGVDERILRSMLEIASFAAAAQS